MNAVMPFLGDMSRFVLLTVPIWLVSRTLWLVRRERAPHLWREVWMTVFVFYLIALLSQTVLPLPDLTESLPRLMERVQERLDARWGINLVPLATIRAFWLHGTRSQNLINLAGNVGMFVPLGLLTPALWKRWRAWWRTVLLCAGCSLFIECFQLFIGRSVDVDDVILNTLGGAIGYLLFALGQALFTKQK